MLYGKRNDLNFPMNFPFMCFLLLFPWYMCLLIRKLLNHVFRMVKLRLPLRQLYDRHHDMVNRYGISVINNHKYVLFYNYNPILPLFMIYHRMPYNCNTTGATSGTGTAYPEFIFSFCGVRVAQSLVFYVVFCVPLFVLFYLAIILSVQRVLITPLISSTFSCTIKTITLFYRTRIYK